MTLEPCRECGQQISTEANTCPHCGVPKPTGSGEARPAGATAQAKSGSLFGVILLTVGVLWAILGLGNIVLGYDQTSGETWAAVSIIFNMVLFIIPGLIVAGIGQMLRRR